ncbi:MAG TPA: flagellar biosynthesis protein FlhF, partial [Roseococcus sp.]|nr:flagellar biosynthesis protein FlhF [Roseococcus sp.]
AMRPQSPPALADDIFQRGASGSAGARRSGAPAQTPAEAAADYFRPRTPAVAVKPEAKPEARRPAASAPQAAAPAHARLPEEAMSFAAMLAATLPPLPGEPQAAPAERVPAPAPAASAPAPAPVSIPAPTLAPAPVSALAPAPAPQPPPELLAEPAAAPSLTVVASGAESARENDQHLVQMRAELASMREMIEREMHRLTDERLRGSPVRAQALELMEDYGFDAGLTRDVALQIPADTPMHRARGLMLGLLSKRLPITAADPLEAGGVIALVGPTGAGKTTTIAKLAATYAARHNARDVVLVTTDTVRVGGREQLHSYGRQLGIAVHEADGEAGLARTLERLRDYRLVLIDTAGMGQRDKNLVAQLNWLHAAAQVHTLLVLPANSHFADLDEVVRRFKGANPQGVVLTKVDETGRLGSALSVVVDHGLPMAWITDGQRVPQDLHRAQGANLVLRLDQLRRDADQPCAQEACNVA